MVMAAADMAAEDMAAEGMVVVEGTAVVEVVEGRVVEDTAVVDRVVEGTAVVDMAAEAVVHSHSTRLSSLMRNKRRKFHR